MQFRKTLVIITGFLFAAGAVIAEPKGEIANWINGPTAHFLNKAEKKEWKKLKTQEEAEKFIMLFWVRRDPTPETPQNEFKEEIDRRAGYAMEAFTAGQIPGSMSDRGKVFILLGPPYKRGTSGDAPSTNIATPNAPTVAPRQEVWTYEKDKLPQFAEMPTFNIVFVDQTHSNRFKLGHSPGVDVNDLIAKAQASYLINPDITEVPTYDSYIEAQRKASMLPPAPKTEFESAALKSAVDSFKAAEASPYKDVFVTYAEFVTSTDQYFVPMQLYFGKEAAVPGDQEVTFFGVLESTDGTFVGAYEEPRKMGANTNGESWVDRSLIVAPGEYKGIFGVASGDNVLAMASADLKLEPIVSDAPFASRLLLSRNIYALTEAQMPTDPFAFGGLKVVPEGDATFTQDDELWYFFEMMNPGTDEAGAPKVKVQIEVVTEVDGQTRRRRLPWSDAPLQAVKDVPGHYIVGSSIPLSGFEPSDYEMNITVRDTVTGTKYVRNETFQIQKGTGQAATQ